MEDNISELNEYKKVKLAENKEIKVKNKKLEKKAKLLIEKEATIEAERNKLERDEYKLPFECEKCDVNFKSLDNIVNHVKTEHVETQTELDILQNKSIQTCNRGFSCDRKVQTDEESSMHGTVYESFVMYPCYYCHKEI